MKKLLLTHLFLNLYLLALIQPALPVIDYLVNYKYIVAELCENRDKPIQTCNGKCYLEKQVKKQLNLTHSEETPMPPKVDFEKLISLKYKKYTYKFFEVNLIENNTYFYTTLNESTFSNSLFRPPIS
ncbi:MAG: hypothetical protein J7K34_07000 [Flavobacteriaceae bacterium]|nr:hypothetical protein [Flavobacteriaceae bacterium]